MKCIVSCIAADTPSIRWQEVDTSETIEEIYYNSPHGLIPKAYVFREECKEELLKVLKELEELRNNFRKDEWKLFQSVRSLRA